MAVCIYDVVKGSPAYKSGISPGDKLISINENPINDVLDYRFYMVGTKLKLELNSMAGGNNYTKSIIKPEYDELGLEFETYLIDKQMSCKNKCVFCFIDQLPKGMRESLYFKDDDNRMSFLFGNYITLTNLERHDIQRIIKMHISPVNISVHTTNPQLRVRMMKNPNSGRVLEYIPMLANAGIKLNTQIVLCPGFNDGQELEKTLNDLCELAPGVQSISVVPVGTTKFREGLEPMRAFTKSEAASVIEIINSFGDKMLAEHGERICYPGDEFFLTGGVPVPDNEYYGEYPQLENGVGMTALLDFEFARALSLEDPQTLLRRCSIATGVSAYGQIKRLAQCAVDMFNGLNVDVYAIDNDFFGHNITVSGLVCGCDIIKQLQGKNLGEELLLPVNMLRHERDLFLDGTSIEDVERALGIKVRIVDSSGFDLLEAMLGQEPV